MKIKRPNGEPRLRKVEWAPGVFKDTPRFDLENYRRLKLELKVLEQPPKMDYGDIIVPD